MRYYSTVVVKLALKHVTNSPFMRFHSIDLK